jgi:hypothetical protein
MSFSAETDWCIKGDGNFSKNQVYLKHTSPQTETVEIYKLLFLLKCNFLRQVPLNVNATRP